LPLVIFGYVGYHKFIWLSLGYTWLLLVLFGFLIVAALYVLAGVGVLLCVWSAIITIELLHPARTCSPYLRLVSHVSIITAIATGTPQTKEQSSGYQTLRNQDNAIGLLKTPKFMHDFSLHNQPTLRLVAMP
jgi:hypothetical protein